MSFPGNINLNNLASLMASAGGAGGFPGLNAAAMAAAAASQPAADGATSAGGAGAPGAATTDAEMINTIEKNLYHDNSRVTPADVDANPRARRANSKREPTFPMKLHSLLSDPEAEGVIVWLPHGRAWKLIKADQFERVLLPRYFDHGNISSFMRQVNGWDFRRIVKGVDEQSYYHEVRFSFTSNGLCSKRSFFVWLLAHTFRPIKTPFDCIYLPYHPDAYFLISTISLPRLYPLLAHATILFNQLSLCRCFNKYFLRICSSSFVVCLTFVAA